MKSIFQSLQMLSLLLPTSLLSLFFFFFIPTCLSQEDVRYTACAPFPFKCGNSSYNISYPFQIIDNAGRPDYCGHPVYILTCVDNALVADALSRRFNIMRIDYKDHILHIVNKDFTSNDCPRASKNSTLDSFSFAYINQSLSPSSNYNSSIVFDFVPFNYTHEVMNLTLYYNCSVAIQLNNSSYLHPLPCLTSNGSYAYFKLRRPTVPKLLDKCNATVILPVRREAEEQLLKGEGTFGDVLKSGFSVEWMMVNKWCTECERSGGRCGYNKTEPLEPTCFCREGQRFSICLSISDTTKRRKTKIGIGIGAGIGSCLLICILTYVWYCKKRLASSSPKLISRTKSSYLSSNSELGNCCFLLPTHVFSYKELEEATNNFHPSKELGDGGFGTVYYGKLYDGRSVAVKRLYETNYRRLEQFVNEIEILSRLHHQNLVSLYGCTSRHSRELLLVYEFIPNGTVADHLHGNLTQAGAVMWPIRMSIAIETADALAYLHAVDIIHRDVKTNNILLDNNFRVKVADFGLSRLFPTDKTHVSTAPQGTPGYVDPDYHRCYQLNNKSDVYSFGVVLFELISSKPAVDITRHSNEINLSYMAISKIHSNALHELVDPNLGFELDNAVRRMITLVAELAYRCLHDEKEMRPTMEEVLKVLREIESDECKMDKAEDVNSPEDDVVLLKKNPPLSPDSIMVPWINRNPTPNASNR